MHKVVTPCGVESCTSTANIPMICCGMTLKSGQVSIRPETLIRTYQRDLFQENFLSRVGLVQNKSCVDKVCEFESKKAKVKRRL